MSSFKHVIFFKDFKGTALIRTFLTILKLAASEKM
jgi:hypothetical protein